MNYAGLKGRDNDSLKEDTVHPLAQWYSVLHILCDTSSYDCLHNDHHLQLLCTSRYD